MEKVAKLSRNNHESWFRGQKLKLKSKKVWYVVEETVEEFAWIPNEKGKKAVDSTTTGGLAHAESAGSNGKRTKFEQFGGVFNEEKKEKYEVDDSIALYHILKGLGPDDEALIDEYETAGAVWTQLQAKYSKTSESSANRYLHKLQSFVFDEAIGIDSSWTKLKELRRKLISSNKAMSSAYPDNALLLVLTSSLPSIYQATKDGLRLMTSMTVEEKIKALGEVEAEHKSKAGEVGESSDEAALAAYRRKYGEKEGKKYVPPHLREDRGKSRESSSEGESATEKKYRRGCYLCKDYHPIRHCPDLALARELLEDHKQAEKKT